MARVDVSALRDEAAKAVERNKLDKAIELYAQIEAAEPTAAQWPKKIGETARKAGNDAVAVAAFERAVDKFVNAGFLVQAIAVCKLILQIDPSHDGTLRRVTELTAATRPVASPADFANEPKRPPQLMPPPQLRRRPAPPPPPPARDAMIVSRGPSSPPGGIAGVEIASIVPRSARRLTNADGSDRGISLIEIEIEDLEPPPDVPSPGATAAERLAPHARLALRRTPLFADLPPRVLESLVNRMELTSVAAGETIVTEGEPGNKLYVISEGEVAVSTAGAELCRLGPSAFFGEIALVTDLPRSATIRAVERVELLAIERDVLREAITERPELVAVLLKFMRDRLIDRVARTSELFSPFTEEERDALAKRFELVEVAPDVELIVQNERADGLYIMLAGQVDVHRAGLSIALLGPGDVFGEMSLLSGGGSTATVRTETRVLALRLPAKTFQEVIMTHPQVLAYLGDLSERRSPPGDEGEPFVDLHLDMF